MFNSEKNGKGTSGVGSLQSYRLEGTFSLADRTHQKLESYSGGSY